MKIFSVTTKQKIAKGIKRDSASPKKSHTSVIKFYSKQTYFSIHEESKTSKVSKFLEIPQIGGNPPIVFVGTRNGRSKNLLLFVVKIENLYQNNHI
jgi:hypothetical protein